MIDCTRPEHDWAYQYSIMEVGRDSQAPLLFAGICRQLMVSREGRNIFISGVATGKLPILL